MRVLPGKVKANHHLAFSPDGQRLVCGGNGRGVAIWDITTSNRPVMALQEGHGSVVFHFDANNGRLFVAFAAGIWTRSVDGVESELQFPDGRPTQIGGFAVTLDGTTAVFSHYHAPDYSGGKFMLARHHLNGDAVGQRVWHADERYVWEGSFVFRPGTGELFGHGGSGCPRTFVTRNPDEPASFAMHLYEKIPGESVIGWALSPDGERIAFTTQNRVRLLDLGTGTETQLPVEPGSVGRAIAFHPGGQLLGLASGEGVKLLDASTLTEVRALSWGNGRVRSLAFAPDGMTGATAGERGWVTLWDVDI